VGVGLPEPVTISWLVRHVPVGLWLSFGALLCATFLAGAKVGQTSLVRELLGEPPFPAPILTQDQLKERVDKLIEGLNANTARITAGIVGEEQSAGSTTFFSDRQPHVEAAQRLRDVLKQEHERFQSSIQALNEQRGK
jgi:hypothetical protein